MSTAAPRKAAIAFILVTITLDMLAMGMIIPVLPEIIKGFVGGDTARAAGIFGIFGTAWAAMQFVFSPVLGGLSDRFGRRPVVLISNFGLGADYLLTALAPGLSWLFAARIISGITAGSISAASAYIADVLPPEKRAQGYGMIGAAFGIGFVLGPALGGLLGEVDPRLPFWVAAGLSFMNGMYGLFVLPESLPKEARQPFSLKKANPLGALRLLLRNPTLFALAGVVFCLSLAHVVLPSCFVLYTGHRYGWGKIGFGLTLAISGVVFAVVQAVLVKRSVARFGELRTLIAGLAFGIAGFFFYGAAWTGTLFLMAVPIQALWGLSGPNVQSMMSRRVPPTEQGAMQGAYSSIQGIAGLIGPTLFTQLFAHSIASEVNVPGAPFFASAVLVALALLIVVTRVRREQAEPGRQAALAPPA